MSRKLAHASQAKVPKKEGVWAKRLRSALLIRFDRREGVPMTSVFDAAFHVLSQLGYTSTMKLQKLVFYSHARRPSAS